MERSKERHLVYLGILVALLPVILLRDFTPLNELRFLSIADEAIRDHHFFAFANHGVPYADKPPLFLWLVMLCRWIAGAHYMWLLSLLSLIPAFGITRIMDRWVKREMDSSSRIAAILMLFTTGLFTVLSGTLRMDMLMCYFIVFSLRTFWWMYHSTELKPRQRWLFPVFLFLGIFSKGPLGLLIPLFCTTVFLAIEGKIKTFARYWGWRTWTVLIGCCALWLGATYLEGGKAYMQDLLFHQTIDRCINSFHHSEPIYYYLLNYWICLAPWSLFIFCVFVASLRRKVVRSSLQRFFQTVAVVTIVVLSCISEKIQIYLLPAIPFFVYATASFLPRLHERMRWTKITLMIPAAAFAAALPTMICISSRAPLHFMHHGIIYATATVLTLSGLYALYLLIRRKGRGDVLAAVKHMGVDVLIVVFVAGLAIPKVNPIIGYGKLCERALEISEKEGITEVETWKLERSENMDVYLHRDVTVLPEEEVPTPTDKPRLLLTRKKDLSNFPHCEAVTVGKNAIVVLK
jgi:4-amino-4-deoxy-L-arabinose transferase-like glycosyltransferase